MKSHLDSFTTTAMTPAFRAANRYLGWGEPKNAIWFVGLEEADGWFDLPENEVVRRYEERGEISPATTQLDFKELGAAGRRIRHLTSRIMSLVSRRTMDLDIDVRWRRYHDSILWRPGSMGFQANLFPLGKPTRAEWPQEFESLFGFSVDDRDAYRRTVAETRWRRLREMRRESRPLATICFGKEAWNDFRAIFEVTSPHRELGGGKIHVHDRERVVLTRFFSRGLVTNADADAAGTLLRDEWAIRIP